jgi:3-oxoacyl-[acyl-carrier protein] reductase
MDRLKDKVAIVTGASKGLGAEIAARFAAEGAAVVVNYASSKAGAEKVVGEILAQGGRAVAVQADVSKRAEIKRLLAETKDAFGRLDIIVNNAGVFEFVPLAGITEEHFHRQFDLNVLGTLLVIQESVSHFGPEGGSVINMSSIVSVSPSPVNPVYSATKAAVDSLTRSLAKELAPRHIRLNTINPSMIATEGIRSVVGSDDTMLEARRAQTPLGRLGTPADIANAAVFLASDESSFMTGENIILSGGLR